MSDCVFCKIAGGQIKSDIVYQDEDVVAFNDIAPQAPSHILLVPRVHVETLADLSGRERAALISSVFEAIPKILSRGGLPGAGYRVVLNQGTDAGQAVPHLHFHLLSGRKFSWPPG